MDQNNTVPKDAWLKDLKDGDRFAGYYLLKTVSSATASNGKPYLNCGLADRTGELSGKHWDYTGPIGAGDAGKIVWANGTVESYNDRLQCRLDNLRLTDESDSVDPARLVPAAPYDAKTMLDYVEKTLRAIEDADYRAVCLRLLERHREDFAVLPGAQKMHHAYLHGLLMHTARMMMQADKLAGIYHDVADGSLLMAGAFLHDIGKLREFERSPLGLVSGYSKEGQLLGHLFLGAEEVGAEARALGIPEEKALLLQHLLASHHGEPELGALTSPRCAEAELLSAIDLLDSRMEMYRAACETTPEGSFTREKVFGLRNRNIYHPIRSGGETPED